MGRAVSGDSSSLINESIDDRQTETILISEDHQAVDTEPGIEGEKVFGDLPLHHRKSTLILGHPTNFHIKQKNRTTLENIGDKDGP